MRTRSRSRMTRRQFLSLAAAAAATPALPRIAAAQQPHRGGTFISAKTTEAPSLDTILEQAASRQRIDVLFYNRLVEWSSEGKLEPALAESWTTSRDGKSWTFKLRRGVKFHTGRELVADDVKFTLERVLDPNVGSGGRGYLMAIEGIETPDKTTVIIHTKTPTASLLAALAGNWQSIVPRDEVEKRGDLRRTAIGTGPFILQEWVPRDQDHPRRGQHHRAAQDW
jgi:peptide/nickel transport system substrate-binding protein